MILFALIDRGAALQKIQDMTEAPKKRDKDLLLRCQGGWFNPVQNFLRYRRMKNFAHNERIHRDILDRE